MLYTPSTETHVLPKCHVYEKVYILGLENRIQSNNFLLCTDISLILFFNINKIYGNYTVISPRRTITYKFYELKLEVILASVQLICST